MSPGISFLAINFKLHNLFEHSTDYLMSCPTDVLLLHALQILKPQLEELMHVLQVLPFAERCGLRYCSIVALCVRNAHITVDDVRRAMQRRVRAAQCRCAVLSRDAELHRTM